MKTNDKLKQLRTKTVDELTAMIENLHKEIQQKQVERHFKEVKDVHEVNRLKKDLARTLTIVNEMRSNSVSDKQKGVVSK